MNASRRIADQGCPGFIVTPRHNVLHLPRRPTAVAIISLILECISSSAIALTAIERVREILGLKASTTPDDNTTIPERSRRTLS